MVESCSTKVGAISLASIGNETPQGYEISFVIPKHLLPTGHAKAGLAFKTTSNDMAPAREPAPCFNFKAKSRQSIDRQDALEDRSGRKDASEKTPHLLARTHDFARVQSKSLSKLGHAFVWHKFGNLKCLVVSFGDSMSRECHTSCEEYSASRKLG